MNTPVSSLSSPVLPMTPRCFHCGDLGFDLNGNATVTECWRIPTGIAHNHPGDAAEMVKRAVRSLIIEGVAIDPHVFHVAKTLVKYDTARPCKRDWLIDMHFLHNAASAVRNLASVIETLRKVWLMPIGSRKDSPSGYWIITDAEDFAAWVTHAKAAPVTQLTTIHRVAKRNFPVFADQLEFDFWNNIEPQQMDAAA